PAVDGLGTKISRETFHDPCGQGFFVRRRCSHRETSGKIVLTFARYACGIGGRSRGPAVDAPVPTSTFGNRVVPASVVRDPPCPPSGCVGRKAMGIGRRAMGGES